MRTKYLLIAIIGLLSFSACQKKTINESQTCSSADFSSHPKALVFQNLIDEYTGKGLPGITLLVKDGNGTWAGASGFADIKEKIKMQPCHIGKVASLTKIVIATLAFKLVEEGKLDLDKKVNEYLGADVLKDIANADLVTVRQLLNHQTGIFDVITDNGFYLSVLNNPSYHRTQTDILKFVRGKPAAFAPGMGPGYSNTNTLLLSMIMDKVGGKPHQTLLHEKILDPFMLGDTYYYYHDALPDGKVAQGYYDLYNNGQLENLSSYNTGSGNGYTGLYSNVFDLAKFLDALFISKTLVSQGSLDQMLSFNSVLEQGSERYLGQGTMKDFVLRANADEYGIGHRGRDLAYSADMFYFPEKGQLFVLEVNYGTDGDSRLRPTFYALRKAIVDAMMQ